ncbi:MAG: leucine-rich repeat domain-containing protein [Muribaculum sp.]|nr:leucine-rich repeat domain-containing protein [Muribaculum sp.]MCM1142017.1 leucine-rich repeat domain-containing protein [Muribaculum sp.]
MKWPLTIPEGITNIGRYALGRCVEVHEDGEGEYNFTGLTTVALPSSIKKLESDAFVDCYAIEKVLIPSLDTWLNIAFENTGSNPLIGGNRQNNGLYINGNLLTVLTVPDSISEIGNYSFPYCKSLEKIVMHDSVSNIGLEAFRGCSNLKEICFGDNVEKIDEWAFLGTNIATLPLPKNLKEIGVGAFIRL